MYPMQCIYRKEPHANSPDGYPDKKKGLLNSKHRVDSFSEHVVTFLTSLKENSIGNLSSGMKEDLKPQIESIFAKAIQELENEKPSLPSIFQSKKEAKEYSKHFRAFEKKAVSIIRNAQLEVAIEITKSKTKAATKDHITKNVELLAKGGLISTIVKLKLYLSQNQTIIENFEESKQLLGNSKELQPASIKRRFGVQQKIISQKVTETKIENSDSPQLYYINVSFSENQIKKQLKSLAAQELSTKKREPIKKKIRIEGNTFTSHQLPLNLHFDEHYKINNTKKISTFFEKMHGNKGVSSTNRQEPKLVNGWESSLEINETPIYKSLRHGIASDKYETNQALRKKNSYLAAKELVTAAITQHIHDTGLTAEELKKQGGIQLTLNSVSLVTPDDIRPLKNSNANEKNMLKDQVEALRSLERNIKKIEWEGLEFPLSLKINTFNFGVNAGAVDFRQGISNQHKVNKPAMAALEEQVNTFLSSSSIEGKEKEHIERLFTDIKHLTAKSNSYLDGDNPYEVGAKILNLTYVMDRASMKTNAKSGSKAAFNCMSGKDRTGIMDNIAKAFAVMANLNGEYPTHEELKNDEKKRAQFRNILIPLLFEAGSLEITELNTGARGYKITKHAMVGGLPKDYLLDLIGLSGTTAS